MAKLKLSKKKEEEASVSIMEEMIPESKECAKQYTDLREVMDTERPFSMLFSGVEDEKNFNLLYDMGIRNFLISYHYVQRKHLDVTRYEELGVKFFVDSGAFTYMGNSDYEEYTIEQWEKHIERYLRWIEKHRSCVFAFASLDIEYIVGGEKVQEWNEKYFEPFMLRTGIPACFVYHDNATKLTWEQYCQRYPYVGISWGGVDTQGSDLNYGLERLRVAEKHNSLVHGMAMTHTSLLTKLPFYTVDSTTWLVGLQYGEINYWTGTKMTRLKKDKWKGNMLESICSKCNLDRQRLLDEENEEMIRANVHAFIEAEEFIQHQLKSRMYWLRPKSSTRRAEDLDSLEYPDIDWLYSDTCIGWEDYAKSFNVSQEDEVTAINCITDITVLMNWNNPDYEKIKEEVYTEAQIKELHDTWINRIVPDHEVRVEDLQKFYTEVLLGQNDKLLVLGTNFDRIVKERDSYVTDEEYELEDVSDLELENTLSKLLPMNEDGKAPEIDELDDEIFKDTNIIPVRDEKGRFVKGQKQVLKPKKLYSEKYPKMACDSCMMAQKCAEYKAGYVCAYNKMFNRFDTRDQGDIIQAIQGIVDFSMNRMQRAMMMEMMNGGIPDPNVSGLMDQSMKYLGMLKQMYETGSQEVLRQTKVVRSDGTEETTTQVTNPSGSGILMKIFGDMGNSKDDEDEKEVVVESTAKERE